jgi:hypothetical protein
LFEDFIVICFALFGFAGIKLRCHLLRWHLASLALGFAVICFALFGFAGIKLRCHLASLALGFAVICFAVIWLRWN